METPQGSHAAGRGRGRARGAAMIAALLAGAAGCAQPGRSVTVYGGVYSDARLLEEILPARRFDLRDSGLVAVAYTQPVLVRERMQWELEGQIAKHVGLQDHWEANALVVLRWKDMPFADHVRWTAAIGEGLSLATEEPPLEEADEPVTGSNELLNYLLLEHTFAPPGVTTWAGVIRIHHRSGIFGAFDGVKGGSNVLTIGLKLYF